MKDLLKVLCASVTHHESSSRFFIKICQHVHILQLYLTAYLYNVIRTPQWIYILAVDFPIFPIF